MSGTTALATCDVRWAAATHPGWRRLQNEDSHLADRPIFLVADGMGGHRGGEVASSTVVSCFAALPGRSWASTEEVTQAVAEASRQVRQLGDGRPAAPGSTLTGVALIDQAGAPCWYVFNIGDSRTYLLSGGHLTQISVDHTAEVALSGSPGLVRSVITRALGAGTDVPALADQWLVPVSAGDRVLVCSDGLTSEVTDQLVSAILLSQPDPQAAADSLIQAALDAGGRDNVTVILVDAIDLVSVIASPEHTVDADEDPTDENHTDDDHTVPDVDAEEDSGLDQNQGSTS